MLFVLQDKINIFLTLFLVHFYEVSMIFDTHAHYDDHAFDEDRDELLSSLPGRGVGRVVNVTSTLGSLEKSRSIAEKYDHIYTSAGLHPTEIYDLTSDALSYVEQLCSYEKTVAVGEIGLDYHYPDTNAAMQKEFFAAQLEIAIKHGLPVIIHSRDAAKDTMDIMRSYDLKDIGGVVHCYSYSLEMAREYVEMGMHIGIGGVVTYKNGRKLKECAQAMPLESIVLETDCPYLSPEPNRGKRNSSLNLNYVAQEIAHIRGLTIDEVKRATWDNALRLYHMDTAQG